MRTLEQALHEHELIVLRVIGEWCELDLTGADKVACVKALAPALANVDMMQELNYLPPEEAEALRELVEAGGKMPVATFSRQHGEVRLMGPGRLEREEPWLVPENPAEGLWYRGFLYRAFDETADGLVEFYYLPEELCRQFPQAAKEAAGRPAPQALLSSADPPAQPQEAPIDAVDDLTTILATAQQESLQADNLARLEPLLLNSDPDRRSFLLTLAWEMGLIRKTDGGARPTRKAVNWLRGSRETQLRALVDAWSNSAWNELCHTPGLICEGSGWQNDPILARTALLDVLPQDGQWYALADLVAQVKKSDPDFQRPDGNYDTWYIRDEASHVYLTGFDSWERVEGQLLRYLVTGPLHWLGMTEVAAAEDGEAKGESGRYRLAERAQAWLAGRPPAKDEVTVPLVVQADGSVLVPFNAERYQRFQVARISEAEPVEPGRPFSYRLTPASLTVAQEQGIGVERVLQFLTEAGGRPLPASTKRALARWAEQGTEARLEQVVILRVRDEAMLETLRSNPKTRPFIGEALGPLAAVVGGQDWTELCRAAAELGLLLHSGVNE